MGSQRVGQDYGTNTFTTKSEGFFFFQLNTNNPVVSSTLRKQRPCQTSVKPPLPHTHCPGQTSYHTAMQK